jgi:hypothetical protein
LSVIGSPKDSNAPLALETFPMCKDALSLSVALLVAVTWLVVTPARSGAG